MAEDKKKTGLSEKIGLFIDKTLTFSGLGYKQDIIDMAEETVGVDSWRKIKTQEDFDTFKNNLESIAEKYKNEEIPNSGKTGGMVMKNRKGNKIAAQKSKVAGRRATRGYGKAFKGK